ncbi:hypothetical protein [Clostridium brassicae]|uniref:Uncharacterized protein n=1 Tax=Clostridium brassicae TaxID=2999072 RepID=A0ABT4D7R8_9CLOT|nr:hypothetical protein [Clostridium brassicae]MCY6958345.1 hypothetical protein [Clostridium brassicae]
MIKKSVVVLSFLFIFLNPVYANAEDFKYVEIFDPKQNKVVKVVQLNSEIQNIVGNWVKNVHGIYGKTDPITDDGYVVKVPFDSAIEIKCEALTTTINEVYILFPETAPPFYIIFESANKASCYPFNGDIDILSKILDFKLTYK